MYAAKRSNRMRPPFGRLLSMLALCFLITGVTAAALIFFRPGGRTVPGPSNLAFSGPANAPILHIRASRTETGPGSKEAVRIEAWLDQQTNEGKVIETTLTGVLLRVETFNQGVYTLYLADGRHAVIRRGVSPGSPYAMRLHNQLFLYKVAIERGTARVVGTGRVGSYTTDQVAFQAGEISIAADVDASTGLVLRERIGGDGPTRQMIYDLIERIERTEIPPDAFDFTVPVEATREEYTENQAPGTVPTPYSVYSATSLGTPKVVFRRASGGPGIPTSDMYYLIYESSDGDVQVISGLPPDASFLQAKGNPVGQRSQRIQVGTVIWEVEETPRGFQGNTLLGGTRVTIHAPNQDVFERVATGLQPYSAR